MDREPTWHSEELVDGSQLVLVPVTGSDTFFVEMIVSVGNTYCSGPNDFELPHLLEHMFSFLTSRQHPSAQENEKIFAQMGILYGASTNDFRTRFYYRGHGTHHLGSLIKMLLHSYVDFCVDETIFKKEKEAVVTELNGYLSNPSYIMDEDLDRYLYRDYPISQYTMQKAKDSTLACTTKQLMTLWRTFYHGNNILFFVGGKFNLHHVRKIFRNVRFSTSMCPPPPITSASFIELTDNVVLKYTLDASETNRIRVMWQTRDIAYQSLEYYTLIFIDWLMVNTFASRLYKRLRLEMGMIYSITAFAMPDEKNHVMYGFRTSVSKKEYITRVIQEIKKQCKRITTSLVTPAEMRTMKNQVAMSFLTENEKRLDPSFWVNDYSESFRLHQPIIPRTALRRHYMSFTPHDFRNLAKKVFNNKTITQIGLRKGVS